MTRLIFVFLIIKVAVNAALGADFISLYLESEEPVLGFQVDLITPGHHVTIDSVASGETLEGFRLLYYKNRIICYDRQGTRIAEGNHLLMKLFFKQPVDPQAIVVEKCIIVDSLGHPSSKAVLFLDYSTLARSKNSGLPSALVIHPAYPNPFNGRTVVRLEVPQKQRVVVALYNVLGQRLQALLDETLLPGMHSVAIQAGTRVSGVYFVHIQTENRLQRQKIVLIR